MYTWQGKNSLRITEDKKELGSPFKNFKPQKTKKTN